MFKPPTCPRCHRTQVKMSHVLIGGGPCIQYVCQSCHAIWMVREVHRRRGTFVGRLWRTGVRFMRRLVGLPNPDWRAAGNGREPNAPLTRGARKRRPMDA